MRDYISTGRSPVKMALGQTKRETEHTRVYCGTKLSVFWSDLVYMVYASRLQKFCSIIQNHIRAETYLYCIFIKKWQGKENRLQMFRTIMNIYF